MSSPGTFTAGDTIAETGEIVVLAGPEPKLIDGTRYEFESLSIEINGRRVPTLVDMMPSHRDANGEPASVFPVSISKRTRWLTFLNERGVTVMAPGVRTHQLSLMFGMGQEWYERAMALPVSAAERPTWSEAVRDEAVRVVGDNTVGLVGAPL